MSTHFINVRRHNSDSDRTAMTLSFHQVVCPSYHLTLTQSKQSSSASKIYCSLSGKFEDAIQKETVFKYLAFASLIERLVLFLFLLDRTTDSSGLRTLSITITKQFP
ncbi:hypothetical protein Y032_0104g3594 [Ancylostoma ceylanicum]|uniref:Uncharacterized protein n=1 Tax=Ancylostoma ceylanicum TaxID=53326 RepID=A0A016TGF9_9BILA|nr:hypothetical protein Y032_0104g3594 [Ancylostoma ceylanicum]